MVGANLNDMWGSLLQKYEENIRDAFVVHSRFTKMANKKMHNIRKIFLKSYAASAGQTNPTTLGRRKKCIEITYIGIHIR